MSLEKLQALGGAILPDTKLPALDSIKGLGPARIKQLNAAGIFTIIDLILRLPRDYDDRRIARSIGSLYSQQGSGRAYSRIVVLATEYFFARGKRVPKIWVEDAPNQEGPSGRGSLLLFGRPFLARQLSPGSEWLLAADFSLRFGELQSSSFEIQSAIPKDGSDPASEFFRIRGRYSRIEGFSAPQLARLTDQALRTVIPMIGDDDKLRGGRFAAELRSLGLPHIGRALESLHHPQDPAELEPARRRLAYAELQQLLLQQRREREHWGGRSRRGIRADRPGEAPGSEAGFSPLQQILLERLPFELTDDQKAAALEINADLDDSRLYRLLQGDVGSGKTLVALLAALRVAESGGQTALMVPTEILARQHFARISAILGNAMEDAAGVYLLTASMDGGEQREVRQRMAGGEPGIYIGTHSLFSGKVEFADLRLVIIDEQHRFGVNQRAQLRSKASCDNLLMLSATPIPRTLTLSVFGGMDISTIRSMPAGRKPIVTHLAVMGKEEKVYQAVGRHLADGQRAYFVYPRIEEDDEDSPGAEDDERRLKSAEAMYAELQQRYPGYPAGLVHGRIPAQERQEIMTAFAAGELSILVATTVIEVGVDVPAATAIVIEHAERFGLAALHQLRGRVGRGELQSYCYLVYDPRVTEDGVQRLRVMKESGDGFVIAEEDLRIRGPGNIRGVEQSGYIDLEFASLHEDIDLIEELSGNLGNEE
jgi:ATP-dependent DNA helicase RecG